MILEQVIKAYKRFTDNQNSHSGFYLYPQYESDLNILLDFVSKMLIHFKEQQTI